MTEYEKCIDRRMERLRAFTMGLGYGKCKENLACEAQIAQQPDMETCKNSNFFFHSATVPS